MTGLVTGEGGVVVGKKFNFQTLTISIDIKTLDTLEDDLITMEDGF